MLGVVASGLADWLHVRVIRHVRPVAAMSPAFMIPVFGVTLPLLSYGGSGLMANLAAIGMLLACAKLEPQARKLAERKSRKGAPAVTVVESHRA